MHHRTLISDVNALRAVEEVPQGARTDPQLKGRPRHVDDPAVKVSAPGA